MAANDRLGNLPEKLGAVAARFVDYWATLPKTGHVPMRAAIEPAAIREILPHFLLWGGTSGSDATWRLVGSGIRDWFGRELTGTNVLDIHADAAKPKAVAAGLAMRAQPCGAWGLMMLTSPQGYDFLLEVLCLPLRDAGGRISLFANTMERVREHRYFDAMAAAGARMIGFVEHRFIDIGAGLPAFSQPAP
ncbi:MAG: PAS domain-containing protein [Candidatus Odyssella sp.]|nr:PAS domain-containing protein [Candidatus Odyssella sp.]